MVLDGENVVEVEEDGERESRREWIIWQRTEMWRVSRTVPASSW